MQSIIVSRRGGPETLELQSVPDPEPNISNDEVVVDVEAAGVNFADTMHTQGTYPGGPRAPYTPGMEFAGRIHASDERVMGFANVARPGGGAYAQRLVARRAQLFPVPEAWSFAEAAAFPVNYFTAYFAYWMCGFHLPGKQGERSVLIHAVAGGVGTAAVQVGRVLSVQMFGTSSSEEKLQHCRALGLDHAINYKKVDYEQEIARLTHGKGVNAVFEMLGGEHTAKSTRCLSEFGKMIVYGTASGAPPQFDFLAMFERNCSVQALWLAPLLQHPALVRQAWGSLMEWARGEGLRPVVGVELPLASAAEAHRMLLERRNYGKVVLTVK